MKPFAVIAALSVLAASPALAQESRYVMEKTDTGFVRMDTVTGAMSVCETNGKQLVCRLAADERHAFQDAIDELHERIDALETKVARTTRATNMISPNATADSQPALRTRRRELTHLAASRARSA